MFHVGQTFRRTTSWGTVEFYELTSVVGENHILRLVRKEYTEFQKGVKVRVSVSPAEDRFLDDREHRCRPYLASPALRLCDPHVLSECIRSPKTLSARENISKCFVHYIPETN